MCNSYFVSWVESVWLCMKDFMISMVSRPPDSSASLRYGFIKFGLIVAYAKIPMDQMSAFFKSVWFVLFNIYPEYPDGFRVLCIFFLLCATVKPTTFESLAIYSNHNLSPCRQSGIPHA